MFYESLIQCDFFSPRSGATVQTLKWLNEWLVLLRPVFETLFFLSGVAVAIIALKGLEQLRIAKETAKTSARREAFKLAADECRNFAERIIPLSQPVADHCKKLNLTSFSNPKFKISGGEIIETTFSAAAILADIAKCADSLMSFLNSMEAFAIFFTSGIADESVAYRETGLEFCRLAAIYMPAIWYLRENNLPRYESTVKLYELWNARKESEALLKTQKSIDQSLKALKKDAIKPIGTE